MNIKLLKKPLTFQKTFVIISSSFIKEFLFIASGMSR